VQSHPVPSRIQVVISRAPDEDPVVMSACYSFPDAAKALGGFPSMHKRKNIALVAHDNRKRDMIEWAEWNYRTLWKHSLICTGTTGRLVEEAIRGKLRTEPVPHFEEGPSGFSVAKLRSGPLGGDQQLGAMIAEGRIDFMIFFWDPMQPQPHDVDVKALLRIAVVYNIPIACNRSTADFIISSPLLEQEYERQVNDFSDYLNRIAAP
jgi:methylglyoxal synthase